jgi:hypothetical protein
MAGMYGQYLQPVLLAGLMVMCMYVCMYVPTYVRISVRSHNIMLAFVLHMYVRMYVCTCVLSRALVLCIHLQCVAISWLISFHFQLLLFLYCALPKGFSVETRR